MNDVYRVTCLTPVHIGSGRELFRDVDFFPQGTATIVLDPERVIALGESVPGLAEAIVRGETARWLESRRVDVRALASAVVPARIEAQRLRAALRTADGRPLVPGSSLKGALRTLLLSAWVAGGLPHGARTSSADAAIAQAVGRRRATTLEDAAFRSSMRRDPQGDGLRLLRVADAVFQPEVIDLVSSKAVGTVRVTLACAEAVRPGATAVTRIAVDRSELYRPLQFPSALPTWSVLAAWSRAHALHLLTEDERYFAIAGADGPRRRCAELAADVNAMPADADTLVLRLGWGTGWRTMTGDLLSDAERAHLGMRIGKTRKVTLAGHGRGAEPHDVFGWIRIDPVMPAEVRALYVAPLPSMTRPAVTPVRTSRATRDAAPEPIGPIEDPFVARLRTFSAKERGQLDQLLAQVTKRSDAAKCLEILGTRLGQVFAGDKRQLKTLRDKYAPLAPYLVKS